MGRYRELFWNGNLVGDDEDMVEARPMEPVADMDNNDAPSLCFCSILPKACSLDQREGSFRH